MLLAHQTTPGRVASCLCSSECPGRWFQLPSSPRPAGLQEAVLLPEEEHQGLAASLDNWRGAMQSVAAAAALQLRVAEQGAVVAVGRCGAGGVGGHAT